MSTIEDRLADALRAQAELVQLSAEPHAAEQPDAQPPAAAPSDDGSGPVDLDEAVRVEVPAPAVRPGPTGGHDLRILLVLAAAVAALVAGGTIGVHAIRGPHAAHASVTAPAKRMLSAFRRPYTRADRLPAVTLDAPGADFVSSRLLGHSSSSATSPDADYWAAVQGDGQICLITSYTTPQEASTGGTLTDCATPGDLARQGTYGSGTDYRGHFFGPRLMADGKHPHDGAARFTRVALGVYLEERQS